MWELPDAKHPIKETKAAAMERKSPKETKGTNTPVSAGWKASLNPISFLLLFPRKKHGYIHNLSPIKTAKKKKTSKASVVQLPTANCFKQS